MRAVPALLIGMAVALSLTGCRFDAQEQDYSYNNPLDPNPDTDEEGDNTGQLVIVLVHTIDDIVVIVNTGIEDTDMDQWKLENENNSASYTFSGFTLASGQFVRIHTSNGTNTTTDLYTNTTTPNWGTTFPNTQAILRNDNGDAIDVCEDGETCWQ